jgi:guanylate kinase
MYKLTPELKKQIEDSGATIHYITLEEFQQITSKGTLLSNKEVQEKLFKKP